ncbi:MAG: exonuclease SbcCD subunit D [Armatimonadota bacterium]|nr:exonuclease SbcCD subunit D [Armatimonadota bacterium]
MTTSKNLRFIHFSDLHLGVETHGKRDPETGVSSQIQDFLNCLDHLVKTAITEQVDMVLFAGDAFHSLRPTPLCVREFLKWLLTLADNQIPVVLIAGNHDLPLARGDASPLDLVAVLKNPFLHFQRRPGWISVTTKSGSVPIFCLPYVSTHQLLTTEEIFSARKDQIRLTAQELLSQFLETKARQRDVSDGPSILLAHLWVENAELSGSEEFLSETTEPVIPLSHLQNLGFCYAALGHIHRSQVLGDKDRPVVYAGSLARIAFDEEDQEKGFYLVELKDDKNGWKTTSLQFLPSPTRRFVTLKFDVREQKNPTEFVLRAIESGTRLEGAVVRATIFATQDQQRGLDRVRIRNALESKADVVQFVRVEVPDYQALSGLDSAEWERWTQQSPLELLNEWLDRTKKDLTEEKRTKIMALAKKLMEGGG